MSSPTRYVRGQWKTVCDICGQRYLSSELKKRWDGLMACPRDWELRQPQDFVRAKPDIQAVPWARPEATTYVFVTDNPASLVTIATRVLDGSPLNSTSLG